jgi:4'-phosphopantetheinyl transferase
MQPAPLIPLQQTEVHIWYVWTERVTDPATLARCQDVLSASEKARHQRFMFEKDRHQFLVSHGFQRLLLARYAAVTPEELEFSIGPHGKPDLAGPGALLPIRFNLSHTKDLAAVGVTLDREIGVDVEYIARPKTGIDLAERYFAPSEVDQLRGLPTEQVTEVFFDFWTLKEAYIKARGMGLALPLDGFAYDLRTDPLRISFAKSIVDDPGSWQFAHCRLGASHKLAAAVHQPEPPTLAISIREFTL